MKATERIADVMRLFTRTSPERQTAEVSRSLNIANSSAHELLNGLAETGMLQKQAPGQFRLGPLVARLGEVLANTDPVVEAARPILQEITQKYGETCHVATLLDNRLVSLIGQEGNSPIRVSRDLLTPDTPVYPTAPGRLLLANLPTPALLSYFAHTEFVALTSRTVTQKSLLRDKISEARTLDYAFETGELVSDLATTAAHVKNHVGMSVGVFCMFIPAARFEPQPRAFATITKETAERISERLGYRGEAGQPPKALTRTAGVLQ